MEDTFDTPFDSIKNSYESFSHSLVASKLWLCEELEWVLDKQLVKNPIVNILASWDSMLAFMMLIRRPKFYGVINAYDIDSSSVANANKICDHWIYEYPKVYNHVKDINKLDFTNAGPESVFINTSVDQMDNTSWYNIIPAGTLVCMQTTDLPTDNESWDIKQSHDIEGFMSTYPMSHRMFTESKEFDYGHLKFKRHMIIGIK